MSEPYNNQRPFGNDYRTAGENGCGSQNYSYQPYDRQNATHYQQQMYQQNRQYRRPSSNGMGTAGFVLSILAWVFCWVPVVDLILWALGLIFSIIGLFKAPRGLAIAGLVLSLVSVIFIAIYILVVGTAVFAAMI